KTIGYRAIVGVTFALRDSTGIGATKPYGRLKERIEDYPQIESRAADCFEHFRSGSLLLAGLAQLTGEPTNLRLGVAFWDTAMTRPFRLWRLRMPPFNRFATCSGAPFHRVPSAERHRSRSEAKAGSGLLAISSSLTTKLLVLRLS